MTTVTAEKFHGTENDFLVLPADAPVPDRAAFARTHCDRETGVGGERTGADGVLFLDLDPTASPVRVTMTLVQPDGSTAAMCGNGARCAAHWAVRRLGAGEAGDVTGEVVVDTDAGPRHAVIDEEVTIEMGTPTFDPAEVPVEGSEPLIETPVAGVTVTAVNTGVPHAVTFVEDASDVEMDAVGPDVRYADVFPDGANFTVAASRPDGGFDQRTYERGVEDETRSCGTGAVAIAATAQRLGAVDRREAAPVYPPGGRLVVTVTEGRTTLRGPVTREFETDWSTPGVIDAADD
jgi:diaminopimelate epimerase